MKRKITVYSLIGKGKGGTKMKKVIAFLIASVLTLALVVPVAAATSKHEDEKDGGIGPVSTYRIVVSQTELRTGPGTSYSSNGTVYEGNFCDKLETSGTWVKVKMTSGPLWNRTGYVPLSCIKAGYTK